MSDKIIELFYIASLGSRLIELEKWRFELVRCKMDTTTQDSLIAAQKAKIDEYLAKYRSETKGINP
jgi:hypothetical protein